MECFAGGCECVEVGCPRDMMDGIPIGDHVLTLLGPCNRVSAPSGAWLRANGVETLTCVESARLNGMRDCVHGCKG